MRKFLSAFKWVILVVAVLLLLGPTVLKRINQIRDEKKILSLVQNPVPVEIDELQAANLAIEESHHQAEDPFDERGKARQRAQTGSGSSKKTPVTDKSVLKLVEVLRDLDHVNAAIIIPKIDVKAPVYYGSSHDVLSIGTGFIEGTALPFGKKGEHAFIAGHRGTYYVKTFVDVGELALKDRFSLLLGNILFVYEVNEIKIIQPWEFDPFTNDPEKSLLTLFTCDPIPTFENRLLITGELVSIDRINTDSDLDGLTLAK